MKLYDVIISAVVLPVIVLLYMLLEMPEAF